MTAPPSAAHPDDAALVAAWRTAAADPRIAAAVDALYADLAAEITARGPVCWASGRCCNFARTGHLLYATGLETALTLARLDPAPPASHPALTPNSLTDARLSGGCPFQSSNLCGVHAIRPLGCRIYFCDRSAQSWQGDLYESAMSRLRSLHDDRAIPYRYAEWRSMLGLFLENPTDR